ncbi:MAG: hypothetical protein IKN04_20170 [Clostridia bacterium]|nr:hypothetical protein [Clostridia bacterium]
MKVSALHRALGRARMRMRLIRCGRWLDFGLLFGAVGVLALLLFGLFLPIPWKWTGAGLIFTVCFAVSGLFGLLWPVSDAKAARLADRCGLQERAQTALALSERDDAMAQLQREDACRALAQANYRQSPLPFSRRLAAVFAVCAAAVVLIALLPDPQATAVSQMKRFAQQMQDAAEKIEEEKAALEKSLSGEELEELRRLMEELNRNIKNARTERDAYLALNEAEKRLESIRSSLSRQSGAEALSSSGLSALAKALESGDQKAMEQAAEDLMQQAEESAQSLNQAASQMEGAAAQAMQAAASALSAGDLSQLQSALDSFSMQDLVSALSQLQSMLDQLRAIANGATASSLSAQGQGQGTGSGSGQGQNQGNGQGGAGRGSTHEDAGYKEDTGRQRGQGDGDPEYRENAYETIYDPTRLDADQTNIQESGALNQGENLQISAGPGLGTGGQVPYREVAAEYKEAAAQAVSRMALPEQEQQWVNDYFAALTSQ